MKYKYRRICTKCGEKFVSGGTKECPYCEDGGHVIDIRV